MKSNELIDNLNWFENICKWADDNNIKNLDRYKRGIPRNKEKLFALKELDLSEFDITYLPKEIGYLTNLVTLDLSFRRLELIPFEIGNLINLENLSLGTNNDNLDLPKSIKNLTNLKFISLCGNFSDESINLLLDLPITHLEITYNEVLSSLSEDFFYRLKTLNNLIISIVNNLVLSNEQYEFALQLRKSSYLFNLESYLKVFSIDVGKGFVYCSYNTNFRKLTEKEIEMKKYNYEHNPTITFEDDFDILLKELIGKL